VDGTLTEAERTELEDLQEQMLRHRHRVAPLPLAHARQLLEELERKAGAAPGPTP
jgi:DNA-directed RNA polymerase subunit F